MLYKVRKTIGNINKGENAIGVIDFICFLIAWQSGLQITGFKEIKMREGDRQSEEIKKCEKNPARIITVKPLLEILC